MVIPGHNRADDAVCAEQVISWRQPFDGFNGSQNYPMSGQMAVANSYGTDKPDDYCLGTGRLVVTARKDIVGALLLPCRNKAESSHSEPTYGLGR